MFPSEAGKLLKKSCFWDELGVLKEKLKICSLFDLYPLTVQPVKGYKFLCFSEKRPIALSDRPDSPENRRSEGNKFLEILRKRPRRSYGRQFSPGRPVKPRPRQRSLCAALQNRTSQSYTVTGTVFRRQEEIYDLQQRRTSARNAALRGD